VAHVHVSHRGRPLSCGVGTTPAGQPAGPDTVFSWTCATKPILAVGLGVLADEGLLRFDAPLRAWLPEAPRSWGEPTLAHLLTHTVGWIGDPGTLAAVTGWEATLEHIVRDGRTQEGWVPGQRAAYSVWTNWMLLGEVVRRICGEPVGPWLERRVLAPAGMRSSSMTLTTAQYDALVPRLAPLQHRGAEVHPFTFDDRAHAAECWPGMSGRGPTADLAALFETILRDASGDGPGLLRRETAAGLVAPVRTGLVDEATGTDFAWGLGLTVDRRAVHPRASAGTFSHGGIASSVVAFADPARSLVGVIGTDGIAGGLASMARRFGVIQALYRDVADVVGSSTGRTGS
jgi:CubicO group peptidase (beta-lactamase class C family)